MIGWKGSRTGRARVARAVFPPQQVAEVKAIACELPATRGLPLSKFSRVELHRLVIERGVTDASASTIWRWLREDAIEPWQTRSWIFPRDPQFAEKAGRVLDLYDRVFEGKRLRPDEYVICADEKSQLQALGRRHRTVPAGPRRPGLVEFEYTRGGTLAYLAAWDVHHASLFDRVEKKTGIVPFSRLVDEVMSTEPYRSARRVFWIVDNGSSHCGKTSTSCGEHIRSEGGCGFLAYGELHALSVKNTRRREAAARSVFLDDLRDALVAESDDLADLAQRDAAATATRIAASRSNYLHFIRWRARPCIDGEALPWTADGSHSRTPPFLPSRSSHWRISGPADNPAQPRFRDGERIRGRRPGRSQSQILHEASTYSRRQARSPLGEGGRQLPAARALASSPRRSAA